MLRPAILFGGNGVLINNIAWLLRRLPVFAVGGTGEYRIRPIHVDDLARLARRPRSHAAAETIDAVGPERPAFIDLVRTITAAVGSRSQDRPGARDRPSRPPPACSAWPCATPCSPPRNTRPWPTAWPTRSARRPAEISLTQWITDHKDTLGRSTPTS